MSTSKPTTEQEWSLSSASERVRRSLRDPATARAVQDIRDEMARDDRDYLVGLAMLRKAAELTQAELAERLGIGQPGVVRTEKADDLLLSTLRRYVEATGSELHLVVRTAEGRETRIALGEIAE